MRLLTHAQKVKPSRLLPEHGLVSFTSHSMIQMELPWPNVIRKYESKTLNLVQEISVSRDSKSGQYLRHFLREFLNEKYNPTVSIYGAESYE